MDAYNDNAADPTHGEGAAAPNMAYREEKPTFDNSGNPEDEGARSETGTWSSPPPQTNEQQPESMNNGDGKKGLAEELASAREALAQITDDSSKMGSVLVYETFMFHKIRALEERIYTLEDQLNNRPSVPMNRVEPDEKADDVQTIPSVRKCNWEQFKNRYTPEDSRYAMEVLVESNDMDGEMETEQLKRLSPSKRNEVLLSKRSGLRRLRPERDSRRDSPRLERVRINSTIILGFLAKVTGQRTWSNPPHTFLKPFRVLIHFHDKMEEEFEVLRQRFGPAKETPDDQASTQAPASQERLQEPEDLKQAESGSGDWTYNDGRNEADDSMGTRPYVDANPGKQEVEASVPEGSPSINDNNSSMFSQAAYEAMKCYIDFVREQLLPWHNIFQVSSKQQPLKYRFDELWALFRVGSLVYEPSSKVKDPAAAGIDDENSTSKAPMHHIRRITAVHLPVPSWEVDDLEKSGSSLRQQPESPEPTAWIHLHSLDYDGFTYKSIYSLFKISHFQGERDIRTLALYPIEFVKDKSTMLQAVRARGKKFQSLIERSKKQQVVHYSGWTLMQEPEENDDDEIIQRAPNPPAPPRNSVSTPTHVESECIIDFAEAFQSRPWWKPEFGKRITFPWTPEDRRDPFVIIQWSDKNRSEKLNQMHEVVITDDNVAELEFSDLAKKDRNVSHNDDEVTDDGPTKDLILSEDDILLLPARVFLYALRDRSLIIGNVHCVRSMPAPVPEGDPFKELILDAGHKSVILSLVHSHFDKKSLRQKGTTMNIETTGQDLIRGKGQGLVILLHGSPGIGKTATAEAVAYSYNKPLFPITCGDLGTSTETVEKNLSDIFRLANRWDCVLLLDEADIFLSERDKKDDTLQRNALVSVFLRTLEYYPGILFLTTNKPGALDEAVTSRVHLCLGYSPLGADETMSLFQNNIKRLLQIEEERFTINEGKVRKMQVRESEIISFAASHFHSNKPSGRWNGRQIRNAFQTAASIAHYGASCNPDADDCYIGKEHFQKVADATTAFTKYRETLFGKTDSERAATSELRVRDYAYERQNAPNNSQMGYQRPNSGQGPLSYNHGQHQSTYGFGPPSMLPQNQAQMPQRSSFSYAQSSRSSLEPVEQQHDFRGSSPMHDAYTTAPPVRQEYGGSRTPQPSQPQDMSYYHSPYGQYSQAEAVKQEPRSELGQHGDIRLSTEGEGSQGRRGPEDEYRRW